MMELRLGSGVLLGATGFSEMKVRKLFFVFLCYYLFILSVFVVSIVILPVHVTIRLKS